MMGNMQLIEIETGLLMLLTFRRQYQTKIGAWIRVEIYPSTLGTPSSNIMIFAKIKTWTLHNYQINYYNCDDHLHHGHHHYQQHHHALYIPHEEQDGRHASGRITVTPHIWLSKLHCCNERRPTKLYWTQLGIWLRLFFCTTKQLSPKDISY